MSNKTTLSNSLRYVLVYVHLDGEFPPRKNSEADITLLRAANLAMRRKAQGVADSFLFMFARGRHSKDIDALANYGFSDYEFMEFGEEIAEELPIFNQAKLLEEENPELQGTQWQVVDEELTEEVTQHVGRWLREKHPGAIAFIEGEYDNVGFWWMGIEHNDHVFEWPFETTKFSSELPVTHRAKAETWLTILGHALELDAEAMECEVFQQQRGTAFVATLCEWLHGFEGASGNCYNDFDPGSVISSIGPSDFFLGFEAARLSRINLDDFCEEYECTETDDPSNASLKLITEELRSDLRKALSNFFGGDSGLFFSLYSAIWPRLDLPMDEAFADLVSLRFVEFSELVSPWYFVTEGWCDSADNF